MRSDDLITIGEVARRAEIAPSALRYYDREGLLPAVRSPGGQRRYPRSVLRHLAFIRAAQNVGLSLDEIRSALATLPQGKTPTKADWTRLSRAWGGRLDAQIDGLIALRDRLTRCIGCGCLSLRDCTLMNRDDVAGEFGGGARYLPHALRRHAGPIATSKPPAAVKRVGRG